MAVSEKVRENLAAAAVISLGTLIVLTYFAVKIVITPNLLFSWVTVFNQTDNLN